MSEILERHLLLSKDLQKSEEPPQALQVVFASCPSRNISLRAGYLSPDGTGPLLTIASNKNSIRILIQCRILVVRQAFLLISRRCAEILSLHCCL